MNSWLAEDNLISSWVASLVSHPTPPLLHSSCTSPLLPDQLTYLTISLPTSLPAAAFLFSSFPLPPSPPTITMSEPQDFNLFTQVSELKSQVQLPVSTLQHHDYLDPAALTPEQTVCATTTTVLVQMPASARNPVITTRETTPAGTSGA